MSPLDCHVASAPNAQASFQKELGVDSVHPGPLLHYNGGHVEIGMLASLFSMLGEPLMVCELPVWCLCLSSAPEQSKSGRFRCDVHIRAADVP